MYHGFRKVFRRELTWGAPLSHGVMHPKSVEIAKILKQMKNKKGFYVRGTQIDVTTLEQHIFF